MQRLITILWRATIRSIHDYLACPNASGWIKRAELSLAHGFKLSESTELSAAGKPRLRTSGPGLR